MNKALARSSGLVALAVLVSPVMGQTINDVFWSPAGTGSWTTGSNWSPTFAVPDAGFNEVATINNGGTAQLSSPAGFDVGGVILGTTDDLGGSLEILSGGSLSVVSNNVTDGLLSVGAGEQTGRLVVERGGSLTVERLSTFPAGDTEVVFGGGSPPAAVNASIDARAAFLRSPTRLIGSSVAFTADQLSFDNASVLTYEVNSTGNSTISVAGPTLLAGVVELDFDGVTPTIGDSWTLIDSALFASQPLEVRSADALPVGSVLVTNQTNGGTNGSLLRASVEETLTLRVNRVTGRTDIVNESGVAVAISGYQINSPGGTLNTDYASLADQSVGSFQEASPTATVLGELATAGATAVTAGGFSLGTGYTPPTPAFGTAIDDNVSFTVQRADGSTVPGIVELIGDARANTLVLTIDPATGNARIFNDSGTGVAIDVYSVSSEVGGLETTWDSLADQGNGAWAEANPSANRLSELEPTGELALDAFGWVDLDGLWDPVSGVQDVTDLSFIFRETTLGELSGVVEFATLIPGREGDYNNDGTVDAADYTVWRDNQGTNTVLINDTTPGVVDESDYLAWYANYGLTGPVFSATAVPEPSTLGALLGGLFAVFAGRRGRQRKAARRPVLACVACGMTVAAMATGASAQTTITGADIAASGLTTPFNDGSITITPFAAGGGASSFNGNASFIGVAGGTNDNGVDDEDGDPATTADQERLELTLGSGIGLTGMSLNFSRAYPLRVSGFGSDPLAYFLNESGGGNVLAYDAAAGDLLIFQRFFSPDVTEIGFLNGVASDSQTLTITAEDLIDAGPQGVFTSFTYDSAMAAAAPGDVDGLNGVTLTDFNIIRDNFGVGTTPAEGDLTRDGAVDLADFAVWEANFGGSSQGLARLLGVPEPATAALALLAVALAGRRRV